MMRTVGVPVSELLERGRAALRQGDAPAARDAVEALLRDDGGRGDVLEILARADYLDFAFGRAIERWEQAYAAYRAAGDQLGAIRVARTLSGMYFSIVGDFAVSSGWLARAQTLLEGAEARSELGWVALNSGMFEADRAVKNQRFREALSFARAERDVALELAALAYLGASLVHGDEATEGMQRLDEALAALAGQEVDDFCVIEEVFCQLYSACEHAGDVGRAEQWIRVGEAVAARRNLPAVSAFCRTHYGGVLTAAGRWFEADEALTSAVRLWGVGQRSLLRRGALVRLADLRVRQGRYEEAELLLAEVDPVAESDAARPLAAIHLAKGETTLARDVLEGALEVVDRGGTQAAVLLELLVQVLVADGDESGAEQAAAELVAVAHREPGPSSPYLRALAASAQARVCVASGSGDPQSCFREALRSFARAQMPFELACARLELARALASERPEVALVEARTALEEFERLHAARQADATTALLRRLGVRSTTARPADGGVLTRREAEVLDLVGRGLSNPEIGDRLFISRKTVEHHVGNVLAKLGLRSRAEAAAYAVRASAVLAGEPADE
jgi:DNA-binding NarL/FixJ family response regulator